jgi:hypothetical protein
MTKYYVLTAEGRRTFPHLKDAEFDVRPFTLNPRYARVRQWGKKTWGTWAADWFQPRRKRARA